LLWNRTFGGSGDDRAESIIECSDGGSAVVGTKDRLGFCDIWLIRLDAGGNHLWNRTFGGAWEDEGNDILECSGGGFAITGCATAATFDSTVMLLLRTDS
jgi:hypothetical protein